MRRAFPCLMIAAALCAMAAGAPAVAVVLPNIQPPQRPGAPIPVPGVSSEELARQMEECEKLMRESGQPNCLPGRRFGVPPERNSSIIYDTLKKGADRLQEAVEEAVEAISPQSPAPVPGGEDPVGSILNQQLSRAATQRQAAQQLQPGALQASMAQAIAVGAREATRISATASSLSMEVVRDNVSTLNAAQQARMVAQSRPQMTGSAGCYGGTSPNGNPMPCTVTESRPQSTGGSAIPQAPAARLQPPPSNCHMGRRPDGSICAVR
ncbi:hypothetical protein L6Q21_14210 [Sandaracinobacter sp. RS1-74]|uniref:hypothetical protein n=1 Tax=Sandaracinobacteroides sayramensis TaxID=2913411 RepID=UPI001EDB5515|nr:hypothetical protein [Sandaracinobacteroides sayramensis]MCG2842138.1 hypothetical protein [Sandaracinobacteroides sayramensis]